MWEHGVEVALKECLRVTEKDRVLILSDEKNRDIGEAFFKIAKGITDNTYLALIEDFAERPLTEYPNSMKLYVDFVKPTVSIYAASTMPGELPLRKGYIEHVISLNAKHAHMPGVTKEVIEEGLRSCEEVKKVTLDVYERVRDAKEIRVTGMGGTEIFLKVGKYRWTPDTGILDYGEWGNLPAGEVFTAPVNAEGKATFSVLGDYFVKYGKLSEEVTVIIENGEVVDVKGGRIAEELWKYITSKENGTRIGEVGIGTNVNIKRLIGNLLLDEKYPGVHLAMGDPLSEHTGADWSSDIHVDGVIENTSIEVDGAWLMRNGVFVAKK